MIITRLEIQVYMLHVLMNPGCRFSDHLQCETGSTIICDIDVFDTSKLRQKTDPAIYVKNIRDKDAARYSQPRTSYAK